MQKKKSILKEFFLFYPAILKNAFFLLLTACSGILLAFAAVYPLWFTAVKSKTAYNRIMLSAAVLLLIIVPVRQFLNLRKSGSSLKEIIKKVYIPFIINIISAVLILMAILTAVMFFISGSILGGVIASFAILLLAGIFSAVRKKVKNRI